MEEIQELKDMQAMMQMYLEQMQLLQKDVQDSYELINNQKEELRKFKDECQKYKLNLEKKHQLEMEQLTKEITLLDCMHYFAKPDNAKEILAILEQYTQYKNYARIDIVNEGTENNALELIEISDNQSVEMSPNWFNHGNGHVIESPSGNLIVVYKCLGKGNVKIKLRGLDVKYKNCKIPVWVQYSKFIVNDNIVFNRPVFAHHEKEYIFVVNCSDNELVKIELQWQVD